MTKYIKNLLKLSLIVSLLVACSLTGKAKLESSVKDITDEINKAIEAAKAEGVDTDAFIGKKTGGKVAGPKIREAKMRVIALTEKFLEEIKEEATKLKENGGGKDEFLELYNLMYKIAKAVEGIGVGNMTGTVKEAAEKTPATTAEGIIEIAKAMKTKLKNVESKQPQIKK
ncbi:Decorin binding protein A (plasmid) [Borreliella garinii BgVir]|uniref:decorin-binding protein DbpA n=1 Tax=Borreliella garinii TaxID=29519 RepID=UPI000242FA39|nr:decorin-binding protein DbpA [Borreliella garinii]AEW69265.1 Decorin binding protein A [Borreliella garinii BgVir]